MWLLAGLGCEDTTAPSALHPSYFLFLVDGELLPATLPDGRAILSGHLIFGQGSRPRGTGPETGTVEYVLEVRGPDQVVDRTSLDLDYSVDDGILRIDLCPRGSACLIATELVGPITGRTDPLILTHHLGGVAGSVYSYHPVLTD